MVAVTLGPSPLRHDVTVDLEELDDILDGVTAPDTGEEDDTKTRTSARAKAGELLRSSGRWTRSRK